MSQRDHLSENGISENANQHHHAEEKQEEHIDKPTVSNEEHMHQHYGLEEPEEKLEQDANPDSFKNLEEKVQVAREEDKDGDHPPEEQLEEHTLDNQLKQQAIVFEIQEATQKEPEDVQPTMGSMPTDHPADPNMAVPSPNQESAPQSLDKEIDTRSPEYQKMLEFVELIEPKLLYLKDLDYKVHAIAALEAMQVNLDRERFTPLNVVEYFNEESYRNIESIRDLNLDPIDEPSDKFPSERRVTITTTHKDSIFIAGPNKRNTLSGFSVITPEKDALLQNYMSLNKETNKRMLLDVMELGKKDVIQEDYVRELEKEDESGSDKEMIIEGSGYAGSNESAKGLELDEPTRILKGGKRRASLAVQADKKLLKSMHLKKPKSNKKNDLLSTTVGFHRSKVVNSSMAAFKQDKEFERVNSLDEGLVDSNVFDTPKDEDVEVSDILKKNSLKNIIENSSLRNQITEKLKRKTDQSLLDTNVASYNNFAVQKGQRKVRFDSKNPHDNITEEEEEGSEVRSGFGIHINMGEAIDSDEDVVPKESKRMSSDRMLDSMNAQGENSFHSSNENSKSKIDQKAFAIDTKQGNYSKNLKILDKKASIVQLETNAEALQKNIQKLNDPLGKLKNNGPMAKVSKDVKQAANDAFDSNAHNSSKRDSRQFHLRSSKQIPSDIIANMQAISFNNVKMSKASFKNIPLGKADQGVFEEVPDEIESLDGAQLQEYYLHPEEIEEKPAVQDYIKDNLDNYINKQQEANNKADVDEGLSEEGEMINSLENFQSAKSFKKEVRRNTFSNGEFILASKFQTGQSNLGLNSLTSRAKNDDPISDRIDVDDGSDRALANVSSKQSIEDSRDLEGKFKTYGQDDEDGKGFFFMNNLKDRNNFAEVSLPGISNRTIDLGPYGNFFVHKDDKVITLNNLRETSVSQSLRSIAGYKSNQYESLVNVLWKEKFEPKLRATIMLDLMLNAQKRKTIKDAFLALKVVKLINTNPKAVFVGSLFDRLLTSLKLTGFIAIYHVSVHKQIACLSIQKMSLSLLKRHFIRTFKSLEAPPAVEYKPDYSNFQYPLKLLTKLMAHVTKEKLYSSYSTLSLLRYKGESGLQAVNSRVKDFSQQAPQSLFNTKNLSQDFFGSKASNNPHNAKYESAVASNIGDDHHLIKAHMLKNKLSVKSKQTYFPLISKDGKNSNYFKFRNNVNNPIQAMKADKMSISSHRSANKSYKKLRTEPNVKSSKRHSAHAIPDINNIARKNSDFNNSSEIVPVHQSNTHSGQQPTEGQLSNFFLHSDTKVKNQPKLSSLRAEISPVKAHALAQNHSLGSIIGLTKEIQAQLENIKGNNQMEDMHDREKKKELASRLQEIQQELTKLDSKEANLDNKKVEEIEKLEKSLSNMVLKISHPVLLNTGDKGKEADNKSLTARRYQPTPSLNNSDMNIKDPQDGSLSNGSFKNSDGQQLNNQKSKNIEDIIIALEQLSHNLNYMSHTPTKPPNAFPEDDPNANKQLRKNQIKSSREYPKHVSINLDPNKSSNSKEEQMNQNLYDFVVFLNVAIMRKIRIAKRLGFEYLKTQANFNNEHDKKLKLFFLAMLKNTIKRIFLKCSERKKRSNEKLSEIVVTLSKRYRVIVKKVLNVLRMGKNATNSMWSIKGYSTGLLSRRDHMLHNPSVRKSNEIHDSRVPGITSEKISLVSKGFSGNKESDELFFKSLENEYLQTISKHSDQNLMMSLDSPARRF